MLFHKPLIKLGLLVYLLSLIGSISIVVYIGPSIAQLRNIIFKMNVTKMKMFR